MWHKQINKNISYVTLNPYLEIAKCIACET